MPISFPISLDWNKDHFNWLAMHGGISFDVLMQPISKWIDKSISDGHCLFVSALSTVFSFIILQCGGSCCCVCCQPLYNCNGALASACVKLLTKPQFTQFCTKAYMMFIRLSLRARVWVCVYNNSLFWPLSVRFCAFLLQASWVNCRCV